MKNAVDVAGISRRAVEDPRVRKFVRPTRVVWTTPGETAKNCAVLMPERTGQVALDSSNPCVLDNHSGPAGLLLDFGVELHGGVQLMAWGTKNNQPVRLRVRFGESVSEAMSELGEGRTACNDHAIRDQTCLVPWLGTNEIGNTGFRFVRIDLMDDESRIEFKSIRAVFLYRDLEYKGSFQCNDERLNKIWQTGAYTVHLNMQDYLWDGIKRDRLVWIGDMHPETMTILSVFGANPVVPASLDLVRDETPLPRWMNGPSSYSMWWIMIQHAWYLHTGDMSYLKQQRVYLAGLMRQLCGCIDEQGREKLPPWRFLDWPSSDNEPVLHAGLHALLVSSLRMGAELCGILKEKAVAKLSMDAVAVLSRHTPDPAGSKQGAALLALAGLGDPCKLNKEVIAVDGSRRMSTFYGYYVLQARALAGDYAGALDSIREYWGAMLDMGATTFWEDFNLDWLEDAARIDELVPAGKKDLHGDFGNYCYKGFRHSLCHGWASGPTAWLSEHVLGIKVLAPGMKKIAIAPHLAGLKQVEGTFPTSFGPISVKHIAKAGGQIKTVVSVPKGIKVVG